MTVDIIIPTYKPGRQLEELLRRLQKQDYPLNQIIIINTEEKFWELHLEENQQKIKVYHIKQEEFDHGGTRQYAASLSTADILVYMTQDAMPKDRFLIDRLVAPIETGEAQAAYGRQLPAKDCRVAEAYTREFNYPAADCMKSAGSIKKLGIKTYFCSNVCAAYNHKVFDELGGFDTHTIFNEDMIFGAQLIKNGYRIAYVSEAMVIHSHNYSGIQQMHRNFDLGVSQANHPEIFHEVPSEGEGMRLVKSTAGYLIKKGCPWLLIPLIWQSGCKFIGYRMGKKYKKLPKFLIARLTMNPGYWKIREKSM